MSFEPKLDIDSVLEPRKARAALVWGLGLPSCEPTQAAEPWLAEILERARAAGEGFLPPARKAAVRDMLRHGAYKPAGRAKPSSEYLLAAALADDFPIVNGPVDANNAASLAFGYPASVFDLAKTGSLLRLSRGRAGESYVFNPSGQEIDLEDLLLVQRPRGGPEGAAADGAAPGEAPGTVGEAPGTVGEAAGGVGEAAGGVGEAAGLADGDWEACGNPVKDAAATKVFAACRDVVAVVYAPMAEPPGDLEACASLFARLLSEGCGAASAGFRIV